MMNSLEGLYENEIKEKVQMKFYTFNVMIR